MNALRPRRGDQDLPIANRVALTGPLDDLRFPDFCPACERPACEPIDIQRVFATAEDADETQWRHVIECARPLFCARCAKEHRAQCDRPTLMDHFQSALTLGIAIPALFLGYFACRLAKNAWETLARGGIPGWEFFGAAAFFLQAFLLLALGWWRNRWKRIAAPTSVSAAFDFGSDRSTPFKTWPRQFAFTNSRYAHAFAGLNEARSLTLLGARQKRIERVRLGVALAIAGGVLLMGRFLLGEAAR